MVQIIVNKRTGRRRQEGAVKIVLDGLLLNVLYVCHMRNLVVDLPTNKKSVTKTVDAQQQKST